MLRGRRGCVGASPGLPRGEQARDPPDGRLERAPCRRRQVWQQHGEVVLDAAFLVRPGDLVSTSPASTLLPPNLPVGVVQSVDALAVPSSTAVVQLIAAPEAIDWVQVRTR